MNSITGYITFGLVILLIAVLLYVYIRIHITIGKAHVAEQERKERLTLQLHPTYRQKLAEDRAYELERQRLELARERQAIELSLQQQQFHLNQYLALTRLTPEQYLLDYQPTTITPLPSLKKSAPVAELTQAQHENLSVPTFTDIWLDLSDAHLSNAHLSNAHLVSADLSNAHLLGADLSDADLSDANLIDVELYNTIFANVDLRSVNGLVEVNHIGPSIVQLHTVRLPQDGSAVHFLRGTGLPDEWIDFYRASMMQPIVYHSVFISYSGEDEDIAKRLHADLQNSGVR